MSEFGIRDTGAVAKAWTSEIKDMKPPKLFGDSNTTQQAVDGCKGKFESFFKDNLQALKSFVPVKDTAKFESAAKAHLDRILDATFAKVAPGENGQISKADAHRAMKAANAEARQAIAQLAEKYYGKTTSDWEGMVDTAARFNKDGDKQTVKAEAFGDTNQALQRFLNAKLDDIRESVPKDKLAEFDKAAKALKAEGKRALAEAQAEVRGSGGSVSRSKFDEGVRNIHTQLMRVLMEVRSDFAKPDLTPQVVKGEHGITVLRKAPTIENLVLQGGGAKGVGNPPALLELSKTGMVSGLKHVVGTSAGALTASCLASGMSGEAFQTLMDTTPMPSLAEKLDNFATIYPQIKFGDSSDVGWFDAKAISSKGGGKDLPAEKAFAILDQQTARSVGAFVDADGGAIQRAVDDGRISQQDAERLDVFKGLTDDSFKADRTDKMVTFNDLSILHKVKPETFKELTLTGFNKTDKKEEFFNAANNPDMPVALAGRISMAIPVYFAPVEVAGKKYVDGGVGSNVPSEAVLGGKKDQDLEQARARTMVMVFDDKGKAFHNLHGRNLDVKPTTDKEVNDIAARVVRDASGADYIQTLKDDNQKVWGSGTNVHVVFHGSVDTFDLHATDAQKEFAKQVATLRTLEQIEQRQNEAQALTVDNIHQVLGLLSAEEKNAVFQAGEPTKATYPRDEDLNVAKRLFDLCAEFVRSR